MTILKNYSLKMDGTFYTKQKMYLTIMPEMMEAAKFLFSPSSMQSHLGQLQLSRKPDMLKACSQIYLRILTEGKEKEKKEINIYFHSFNFQDFLIFFSFHWGSQISKLVTKTNHTYMCSDKWGQ